MNQTADERILKAIAEFKHGSEAVREGCTMLKMFFDPKDLKVEVKTWCVEITDFRRRRKDGLKKPLVKVYRKGDAFLSYAKKLCNSSNVEPQSMPVSEEEIARVAEIKERLGKMRAICDPGKIEIEGPKGSTLMSGRLKPFRLKNLHIGWQPHADATRAFAELDKLEAFLEKYLKNALTRSDQMKITELNQRLLGTRSNKRVTHRRDKVEEYHMFWFGGEKFTNMADCAKHVEAFLGR